MSDPGSPTPQADVEPLWQWPLPPGGRRVAAVAPPGTPEPCQIETQTGLILKGLLLRFDPQMRRLQFRAAADGPDASLPFAGVRRLCLTTPLQALPRSRAASRERLTGAAQERDYTLQQVGHGQPAPLTGRTAGFIEAAEGMYLFSPADEHGSVRRLFVPRSAYSRSEFGPSAEELAARHWIASPARLLEALRDPQRQPVIPLGKALLALGLLTEAQLQRALQRADPHIPLGETLVAEGLVSRTNLQTALAHKMGYPLVDLERFPIDRSALAMLPRRAAIAYRMLPLLRDGARLVVAVDRPGRVLKLREDPDHAALQLLPALALKSQIMAAMDRQSGDGWNADASERADFFDTTT
jgi:hypothetical protein